MIVAVVSHSHTLKSANNYSMLELVMNTLLTIAVIVVILWLVGFFALPGVGALIHILLVIAVIFILVWLFTGKKLWK
jgi:hypothetical protein